MAKRSRVRRKLRDFLAGIDVGISTLKRVFGRGLSTWSGL
jgi:hypothetical protein